MTSAMAEAQQKTSFGILATYKKKHIRPSSSLVRWCCFLLLAVDEGMGYPISPYFYPMRDHIRYLIPSFPANKQQAWALDRSMYSPRDLYSYPPSINMEIGWHLSFDLRSFCRASPDCMAFFFPAGTGPPRPAQPTMLGKLLPFDFSHLQADHVGYRPMERHNSQQDRLSA